jgi:hypothetical protein
VLRGEANVDGCWVPWTMPAESVPCAARTTTLNHTVYCLPKMRLVNGQCNRLVRGCRQVWTLHASTSLPPADVTFDVSTLNVAAIPDITSSLYRHCFSKFYITVRLAMKTQQGVCF